MFTLILVNKLGNFVGMSIIVSTYYNLYVWGGGNSPPPSLSLKKTYFSLN